MAWGQQRKWSRRDLTEMVGELDHWLKEVPDDDLAREARRAISGYLKRGHVPRNLDLPELIDDLNRYRDGKMDAMGKWLTAIMNALRSIE